MPNGSTIIIIAVAILFWFVSTSIRWWLCAFACKTHGRILTCSSSAGTI